PRRPELPFRRLIAACGCSPRLRPGRTGPPAAPSCSVGVDVAVRFRVEQAVGVDDEVAHQRVVDGGLRLGLPGRERRRVVRVGAHEVDLAEVAELVLADLLQLAADDEVQQLMLGHREGPPYLPAIARASISSDGALAAPRNSRSEPGTIRPYASIRLPATVISLTG